VVLGLSFEELLAPGRPVIYGILDALKLSDRRTKTMANLESIAPKPKNHNLENNLEYLENDDRHTEQRVFAICCKYSPCRFRYIFVSEFSLRLLEFNHVQYRATFNQLGSLTAGYVHKVMEHLRRK
jgi:hypothetical protein